MIAGRTKGEDKMGVDMSLEMQVILMVLIGLPIVLLLKQWMGHFKDK